MNGRLWALWAAADLIYLVLTVMFFDVLCCAATLSASRRCELINSLLESVESSMVSAVLSGVSHGLAGS